MDTQQHPIESIVERWREGASLQQIAAECGVSRQRISQRLIEAGYSPAERRAQRIASRTTRDHDYKQQRAETLAIRAEARDAACDRFAALAGELGVSPVTLGSYTSKTGMYAKDKGEPVPGRYGRGKLPARLTPEGAAIAHRAREAAAPWAAKHIGNLTARREWLTRDSVPS